MTPRERADDKGVVISGAIDAQNQHIVAVERERDEARAMLADRDRRIAELETALQMIARGDRNEHGEFGAAIANRALSASAQPATATKSATAKLGELLQAVGAHVYIHKDGCDMNGGDCSMQCGDAKPRIVVDPDRHTFAVEPPPSPVLPKDRIACGPIKISDSDALAALDATREGKK
jgi:hypothetical protein